MHNTRPVTTTLFLLLQIIMIIILIITIVIIILLIGAVYREVGKLASLSPDASLIKAPYSFRNVNIDLLTFIVHESRGHASHNCMVIYNTEIACGTAWMKCNFNLIKNVMLRIL